MSAGESETWDDLLPRPSLERLEQIVQIKEQQLRRVRRRREEVEADEIAVEAGLEQARAARAAFIKNNPDPQLMML